LSIYVCDDSSQKTLPYRAQLDASASTSLIQKRHQEWKDYLEWIAPGLNEEDRSIHPPQGQDCSGAESFTTGMWCAG